MATPIDVLCKGAPCEFATYLNYCRSLRFEEKPDYSYLRQLFRNLFHKQGFTYDYVFDWNMLKFGGSRPESDGNDPKDRERKQRHQRTAAAVAVAATGASAAVPGNGASAMDTNRGPGIAGAAVDATSKPHQMAPPESPFGTGQPPVQVVRRGSKEMGTPNSARHLRK